MKTMVKKFSPKKLAALIKKKKLTPAYIVYHADISGPTLTNALQGTHEPSLRVAVALAQVLEVSVEDLLEGKAD